MSASECVSMIEQSFDMTKVDIPTHMKTKQPSKPDFTGLPEGAAFPYSLFNYMPPVDDIDKLTKDIQDTPDDAGKIDIIIKHIIDELKKKYPNEDTKIKGFVNFLKEKQYTQGFDILFTDKVHTFNHGQYQDLNWGGTPLVTYSSYDTSQLGQEFIKTYLAAKIVQLDNKQGDEYKKELKKVINESIDRYEHLKNQKVPLLDIDLLDLMGS